MPILMASLTFLSCILNVIFAYLLYRSIQEWNDLLKEMQTPPRTIQVQTLSPNPHSEITIFKSPVKE